MRKHRMFGINCLMVIATIGLTFADGTFEDADKSNDFTSGNTNQHYDLRHTIPGEPEIDYPIYSAVPKTSFKCTGRHEGYYADMESRCQAFRICAHTARSVQGFGFLCPNGTLFSQKNFVCDWYRNVNCDDSERFFSKNDVNRVGSNYDMMETVRQMMEYPMKTISKALQQNTGSSKRPTHGRQTLRKELNQSEPSESKSNNRGRNKADTSSSSRKAAVTRAQIESAYSYATTPEATAPTGGSSSLATTESDAKLATKGTQHTTSSAEDPDSIYVNSLGELSTDLGANFDRTNAHIIAEAPSRTYQYDKKMNFAEKVNAGLNDLAELPENEVLAPEYVKRIRHNKDEATQVDLVSNINGLLDEIASDVDPSVSGYQVPMPPKAKHAIRFLSRGFSSQSDRARDAPYVYKKPKQTASTIRFSPNEIPIDNNKDSLAIQKTHESSDESIQFTFMTTTQAPPPSTPPPSIDDDSYLTAATLPPLGDDSSYLSAPPVESVDSPYDISNSNGAIEFDSPIITETIATEADNVASYTESSVQALIDTTTPTENTESESSSINPVAQEALIKTSPAQTEDPLTAEIDNEELVVNEEKLHVHNHAANLLLAGVKLTTLDNKEESNLLDIQEPTQPTAPDTYDGYEGDNGALLIQVVEDPLNTLHHLSTAASVYPNDDLSQLITFTPSPISTSTETITEVSSTQERIRNYRRFATLQRATAKPVLYGKRAHVRAIPTVATTTTTAKPFTTRSYLKRVAASRLRLSRLAAAKNSASATTITATTPTTTTPRTTAAPTRGTPKPEVASKKVFVRNLDKESANLGVNSFTESDGEASGKSRGPATWESVRNSLQRFQVNRKRSYTSTSAPVTSTSVSSNRNALPRSRNRFSNFKTQMSRSELNKVMTTTPAPAPPPTTATTTTRVPYIPPQQQYQQQEQQQQQTLAHPLTSSSSTSSSSSSTSSSNYAYNSPTSLDSILNSITASNGGSTVVPTNTQPQSTNSMTKSITSSTSTSSSSTSSSSSPSFLSFDKLTRAIVDESILQNFRSNQATARNSGAYQPIAAEQPSRSYQAGAAASAPLSNNAYGSNSILSTASPTVSAVPAFGYGKIPAQAPSKLTPPQRPQHLPQVAPSVITPTVQTPRIVIARAEGQRIEPNSVSAIISSLATQQKPKSSHAPYVPLDDFLTKKFNGNVQATKTNAQSSYPKVTTTAATFLGQHQQKQQQQQYQQYQSKQQQVIYNTGQYKPQQSQQQTEIKQQPQQKPKPQQQQQQQQQPQRHQQQQHSQYQQQQSQYQQQQNQQQQYQQQQNKQQKYQQQQPQSYYQQSPTPTQQSIYLPQSQQKTIAPYFGYQQHQQQPQQQLPPPQQQPLLTQNIFASFHQNQQQLPQFPPLGASSSSSFSSSSAAQFGGNAFGQPAASNIHRDFLNIPLPALANGLIPAPTTQVAQKRSDSGAEQLQLTASTQRTVFTGASSYEVPLSSIGRLPNDITQALRRQRKY